MGRIIRGSTSSSSGGMTRTAFNLGNLANGATAVLTHPAWALDRPLLYAAMSTASASFTQTYNQNTWTPVNWSIQDENTSGRSWIRTSANKGQLSGPADPGVQRACAISIGGVVYKITSLTGDGTGVDSVELSGDPATGPIAYIHGLELAGQLQETNDGAVYPVDYWYQAESLISVPAAVFGTLSQITDSGNCPANTDVVYLFSTDNKVTWKYYDGAVWLTSTRTQTEYYMGQCCQNGGLISQPIKDSAGVVIPEAALEAMGYGPSNPTVYVTVAMRVVSGTVVTPSLSNLSWSYTTPADPAPIRIGQASTMGGPEILAFRKSTTQLAIQATKALTAVYIDIYTT